MIKFQVGAQDKLFHRWGEKRYQKAREFGFTHIDFSQVDNVTELYTCSDKELENKMIHEKELLQEAGLFVSQVHGPWRFPPKDFTDTDRADRMEKIKRSMNATKILGCENWVIHPIMPFGWDEKITNPGHEQQTWEINCQFMREILTTAKEYDITICLENMPMPNFSIGSPEEILRFVKEINDDHFKICLDTGHAAVYPNGNPAAAVRMLGDYIKVLHVHDNNGVEDFHWLPYFGIINWNEFGKALNEIGFQGVFSYESYSHKNLPSPYYENTCRMMVEIAEGILK